MTNSTRKIARWLKGRGYRLIPGQSYACFWQDHVITYRPQDSWQTQVSGLLHECGHVMIGRRMTGTRYKRGYPSPWTGKSRPNVSAVDLVHEEIEAWHRGFALGRRLHVRVDSTAYWVEYGMCIKKYMRRALARTI